MPRVKLDYVVSFSSEDPDNQASNLLAWDVSKKKWLCSKGETSCSIVLQLARAVKIEAVHVGCHLASTVEVLVGRSETPADQFQVLVPRSVVMSPSESRRGEDLGAGAVERVRSFSGDQLAAARLQRWDRVRLVCAQPYNKHCKYGLSFVHIYEPEDPRAPPSAPAPLPHSDPAPSAVPLRLTNFETFSSDEEEFRPGEMFAKLQNKVASDPAPTTTSTESQIKQATSQALKNISESSTKLVKTSINKTQHKREPNKEDIKTNRQSDNLMYTNDDDKPHAKIDHVVQRHKDDKSRDEANMMKNKNKMDRASKDNEDANTSRKRERDRHSNGDRYSKDDRHEKDDRHSQYDRHSKKDRQSKDHRYNKDDRLGKDDRYANSTTSRYTDKNDSGGSYSSQKRKEENSRRSHSDKKDDSSKETSVAGLRAGPVTSDTSTILADVVVVLSGYVNPERARVRHCAQALGARVEHDWGASCTHLICAFSNTPKLKAVRAGPGGAAVPAVRAEWVLQCRARRRRLPWQWFATETRYRLPEAPSPDPSPPPASPTTPKPDSECDTDDEIQRVLVKKKRRLRSASPPGAAAAASDVTAAGDDTLSLSVNEDVSLVRDERVQAHLAVDDEDCDSDVTEPDDTGGGGAAEVIDPKAALGEFFEGYTFVIEADVARARLDRALLARYVRAYGGLVVEGPSMGSDVNYVVSVASPPPPPPVDTLPGGAVCVSPEWIWRCHAQAKLCPHRTRDR